MKRMKRSNALLMALAYFVFPAWLWSTCHVITPVGSGNKTGVDWNNALAGVPGALIRGDIYYLADGSYSAFSITTQPYVWHPNTTFSVNSSVHPAPSNGHVYLLYVQGKTGSTAPTWCTTSGCIVSDGAAKWKENGLGPAMITIKKAISSDHCTDTGWNGGTMGSGQAVFSGFGGSSVGTMLDLGSVAGTDFITLDGQQRSSISSGYGIKLDGSTCTQGQCWDADAGSAYYPSDTLTLRYIEILGSGITNTDLHADENIRIVNYYNVALQDLYIHDSSMSPFVLQSLNNVLVENNYILRNGSSATNHGGAWQDLGSNNVTMRYNIFQDTVGTSVYAIIPPFAYGTFTAGSTVITNITPSAYTQQWAPGLQITDGSGVLPAGTTVVSNSTSANTVTVSQAATANATSDALVPFFSHIYFYGNVVWNSTSNPAGLGQGIFMGGGVLTDVQVYQNTIANLDQWNGSGSTNCGFHFGSSPNVNINVENNLWYGCAANNAVVTITGSGSVTHDYNTFLNTAAGYQFSTSSHEIMTASGSPSPFTNIGTGDFHLPSEPSSVTGGLPLSSTLPTGCSAGLNCFNIDPDGNIRGDGNWDRGAYQLPSGNLPNPPTNLTATPY